MPGIFKEEMDVQCEQGWKEGGSGPGVAEATHSVFLLLQRAWKRTQPRKSTSVVIIDLGYYCLLRISLLTEKAEIRASGEM